MTQWHMLSLVCGGSLSRNVRLQTIQFLTRLSLRWARLCVSGLPCTIASLVSVVCSIVKQPTSRLLVTDGVKQGTCGEPTLVQKSSCAGINSATCLRLLFVKPTPYKTSKIRYAWQQSWEPC